MNDYLKATIIFVATILVLGVVIVSATNIIGGRTLLATDSNAATYSTAKTNLNANSVNPNVAISNTNAAATVSNPALNNPNDVQIATLKVVNGNYVMTPSVFKKGVLVRITADIANMPGCSKSFTIPDFNIRKSLNANDNVIEFTPDKTGTFRMACTMNMYTGAFSVTDDGTASSAVVQQQAQVASTGARTAASAGGGCSMGNGGGCGCGG